MYILTELQRLRLATVQGSHASADIAKTFIDDQTDIFELLEAVSIASNLDLTELIDRILYNTEPIISCTYYIQLLDLLANSIEQDFIIKPVANRVFDSLFQRFLQVDQLATSNQFVADNLAKCLRLIYRHITSQPALVELLENIFADSTLPDATTVKRSETITGRTYLRFSIRNDQDTIMFQVNKLQKAKKPIYIVESTKLNFSMFYTLEQYERLYEQMQEYSYADSHRVKSARKKEL